MRTGTQRALRAGALVAVLCGCSTTPQDLADAGAHDVSRAETPPADAGTQEASAPRVDAPDDTRSDAPDAPFDAPDAPFDAAPEDVAADAAPEDLPADAPEDASTSPPRCGAAELTEESLEGSAAMVIDHAGTAYLGISMGPPTVGVFIARQRVGFERENAFVALGPSTDPVSQLALVGNGLYVSRGRNIERIDLSARPPTVSVVVRHGSAVDGLAAAPDGSLWFSAAENTAEIDWDSSLWRYERGAPTRIESPPMPWVKTMAFDPRGRLLVSSFSARRLLRLSFTGTREVRRETILEDMGRVAGIAFDDRERIYLSLRAIPSTVVRLDGSARPEVLMTRPSPAHLGQMDFGAGPLRCNDLYVSDPFATGVRLSLDAAGSAVRWHRPP